MEFESVFYIYQEFCDIFVEFTEWSCFGFGMKDKPFFSSCIWVVVNIVSFVSITTLLHSIGSDKGSTEKSFDSVKQDSANDSHRLLIMSLEFCLCLFLL